MAGNGTQMKGVISYLLFGWLSLSQSLPFASDKWQIFCLKCILPLMCVFVWLPDYHALHKSHCFNRLRAAICKIVQETKNERNGYVKWYHKTIYFLRENLVMFIYVLYQRLQFWTPSPPPPVPTGMYTIQRYGYRHTRMMRIRYDNQFYVFMSSNHPRRRCRR